MASSKGSDPKTQTRYVAPSGKIPPLSALDEEVEPWWKSKSELF